MRPFSLRACFAVLVAPPLFAALVGCGGKVPGAIGDSSPGGDPISANPDGGTTTPNLPTSGVEGSFDLTFTNVTADVLGGGAPPTEPPSKTTAARLDIRKNAAGAYEAVLTGRWGAPGAFTVTKQGSSLHLEGQAVINAQTAYDTWKVLELPLDGAGKLTGAVHATGEEQVSGGDVIWQAKLEGDARIALDATAPELRASTRGVGPEDGSLPWDLVTVAAAEPVPPGSVRSGTTLTSDEGAVALAWDKVDEPGAWSWAGESSLSARVSDWTKVAGRKLSLSLSPVKDRVGRASAPSSKLVSFLSIGAPTTQIEFDSDIVEASPWGAFAMYGGGIAGSDDPRCEAGGCARVGPVTLGGCSVAARAGFAGQLTRQGTGHVALRYRVLAAQKENPGSPFLVDEPVTIELATQGGAVSDTSVAPGDLDLAPLGAPIDGMTHGSAWKTLDVAAPAGSGPVGVAVVAGRGYRVGCGGPPTPAVDVEILVESVTAK